MTEEKTTSVAPAAPAKSEKTEKKVDAAVTVRALQSFGTEATGDMRVGDVAKLIKSKTITTLIKSGLLEEVSL